MFRLTTTGKITVATIITMSAVWKTKDIIFTSIISTDEDKHFR